MTKRREASEKRSRNQDGGDESMRCTGPTLGVDSNTGATNVWDKKAWMERLELDEKGLSEVCATVVDGWKVRVELAHPAHAVWSEECVDVVHAQTTCRILVGVLLLASPDQFSVCEC